MKKKSVRITRRGVFHRKKTLPPHSWEPHPLAHKGEANKAFIIIAVAIIALVALSLLLFFGKQFVGQAITFDVTGANQAGIFIYEGSFGTVGSSFTLPIKANLGGQKSVALKFNLTYDNSLTIDCSKISSELDKKFVISGNSLVVTNTSTCANGKITFEYAGLCKDDTCSNALTGDMILANITFTASASKDYYFNFTLLEVYNLSGENIILSVQNAKLYLHGGDRKCTNTGFQWCEYANNFSTCTNGQWSMPIGCPINTSCTVGSNTSDQIDTVCKCNNWATNPPACDKCQSFPSPPPPGGKCGDIACNTSGVTCSSNGKNVINCSIGSSGILVNTYTDCWAQNKTCKNGACVAECSPVGTTCSSDQYSILTCSQDGKLTSFECNPAEGLTCKEGQCVSTNPTSKNCTSDRKVYEKMDTAPTDLTLVDGKVGKALQFDGSSNKIVTTAIELGDSITFEAWIKLEAKAGKNASDWKYNQGIISQYINGNYILDASADGKTLQFYDTANDWVTVADANLAGAWHHVAVTRDAANVKIFIDGTERITNKSSGANKGTTNPVKIGYTGNYNRYFKGSMDEVAVYSRTLNSTEIKEHYESTQDGTKNYCKEGINIQGSCTDKDGDGYPLSPCSGNTKASDCNDSDPKVWKSMTGYSDGDQDGKGKFSAEAKVFCTNGTLPQDYAPNNDDCFDTDQQKVCDPGKKCTADNICNWDCGSGCLVGNTRCKVGWENIREECIETQHLCQVWMQSTCAEGLVCKKTSSSTAVCKSVLDCASNAECKSGLCQNNRCVPFQSSGENISVVILNRDNNLQVQTNTGLNNGEEYIIIVQVRPQITLKEGHIVSVSVSYLNQSQVTRYWVMEPTLAAGEMEVVAFNHKVPEYGKAWGNMTITAYVWEYWSKDNVNLLPKLEVKYVI
ncbi:MAG: LamG-like jellyroll fold domain-containing protein [Candidatus Woesearchaeota archaeon]